MGDHLIATRVLENAPSYFVYLLSILSQTSSFFLFNMLIMLSKKFMCTSCYYDLESSIPMPKLLVLCHVPMEINVDTIYTIELIKTFIISPTRSSNTDKEISCQSSTSYAIDNPSSRCVIGYSNGPFTQSS